MVSDTLLPVPALLLQHANAPLNCNTDAITGTPALAIPSGSPPPASLSASATTRARRVVVQKLVV